jgi:hypothetical protein
MKPSIIVERLAPERLAQAYPLLVAADAGLTLDQWLRFAQSLDGPDSGILAVQTASGYLLGLMTYAGRPDLHYGRRLDVDNFITLHPIHATVARQLLEATDRIAAALDCSVIQFGLDVTRALVPIPIDSHADTALLSRSGYAIEGVRLCKRVETAA